MNKYLALGLFVLVVMGCRDGKAAVPSIKSDSITQVVSPNTSEDHRNVEIVFCLDATGSMSGLIGTAKEKIWDIVSELAQSNDVDTLKMGMVFYRDRGDQFITKQIQLTADLDGVYADLLEMTADGGGDSPESVNKALYESVNNMGWSTNDNTYRTIFVVGDCPPHMDYKEDVLYTVSCKEAANKGIIINTVKLGGSCSEAIMHFKKMAECTNGEFLQLDQNATDYVVATPYDAELNKISREIDDSRLYYGNEQEQSFNYNKKAKSMEVYTKGTATANSARASYKTSKSGEKSWMGTKEIVKDYKDDFFAIESIEDDELPEILKGKSIQEKEQLLKDLSEKRKANILKLKELSKIRKEYIAQKAKENQSDVPLSFSSEVVKIMNKQAKE